MKKLHQQQQKWNQFKLTLLYILFYHFLLLCVDFCDFAIYVSSFLLLLLPPHIGLCSTAAERNEYRIEIEPNRKKEEKKKGNNITTMAENRKIYSPKLVFDDPLARITLTIPQYIILCVSCAYQTQPLCVYPFGSGQFLSQCCFYIFFFLLFWCETMCVKYCTTQRAAALFRTNKIDSKNICFYFIAIHKNSYSMKIEGITVSQYFTNKFFSVSGQGWISVWRMAYGDGWGGVFSFMNR